jgi:hypothetical protein
MSKNIYIDNKYTKTYYRIIDRALVRTKLPSYTEKHHIIPQAITKYLELPESKKVPLTFKEHWTCHHLLLKMVKGILQSKMYYAFDRMGQNNSYRKGRIVNSRMFERIKIANRDACSGENSQSFGNQYMLGFKHSKESKNKISMGHKGLLPTEETKRKMSASQLLRENNCYWKDKKLPNETILKMIDSRSRYWEIIYPSGDIKIIKNLKQFCRENNLFAGNMVSVSQGKYKQHKGFKCSKLPYMIQK